MIRTEIFKKNSLWSVMYTNEMENEHNEIKWKIGVYYTCILSIQCNNWIKVVNIWKFLINTAVFYLDNCLPLDPTLC